MKKMGLKPAKMDEFHQAMTMFEEKPVKKPAAKKTAAKKTTKKAAKTEE